MTLQLVNFEEGAPELNLTDRDKTYFAECVTQASRWLTASGEWRYEIAKIAINLHAKVFGTARWNHTEARMLRTLFAQQLNLTLRTVENWMEVQRYVIEALPETKTRKLSYLAAFEILQLTKNKDVSASKAWTLLQKKDPNVHRLDLMLRYSSNLLASCQKFKISKGHDKDIALVKERLHACLEELEN